MRKIVPPLVDRPLPALPPELAASTRNVQTALEHRLAAGMQNRILIKIEPGQNPALLLICADRLLRFTRCKRLLVLVSTAARGDLVQAWNAATSPEDQQLLHVRYPTRYTLREPSAEDTRLWIATVREAQWRLHHAPMLTHAVDVVLIYDIQAFSPVWSSVLEAFSASYLIGYCQTPTPEMQAWFGDQVIDAASWRPRPASADAGNTL